MLLRINTPHALDQHINIQYNDLSLLPKLNRLHCVSTGILLLLCNTCMLFHSKFPTLFYSKLESYGRNGAFIVRTSSPSSSELVLSVWNEGKCTHFDIHQRKVCSLFVFN